MAVTHFDDRYVRPQRRGRRLLCWWLAISALWLVVVGIGFMAKVDEQIDSTRAIGRELQAMDCQHAGMGACTQAGLADYEGSWTGVATLFATFGFWQIAPIAVLPPAGLLLLGCAFCGCSRMRRKEDWRRPPT